ncbi:MAG TPA: hypothetical protein ENK62_03305 [Chromatiales bacterium]|nr:hypothetical protein [Chromatiales bacterium]
MAAHSEPPEIRDILSSIAPELWKLLRSGTNWRLTLHGGRNGEIKMEILTTNKIRGDGAAIERVDTRT